LLLALAAVSGCGWGRGGREQLGDEAWHDARWADAVADYRAAGDSPRLIAKLADASLEGRLWTVSAAAWTRLGIDAPDRVAEAAAGLARVAALAQDAGDDAGLAQAITGLRQIAPGWPLQRLGARLGGVGDLQPAAMADVIPVLLSSVSGREPTEPLLVMLGRADRARGDCNAAVPILEGVLRTTMNASLRDSATTTLGWCELGLGLSALAAQHPGDAERWLASAMRRDSAGAVGRRARLGYGDARAVEGDSAAARLAWQFVASGTPQDSLTQSAFQRLSQPAPPTAPDTAAHPEHH
jgi:hypothetical protein